MTHIKMSTIYKKLAKLGFSKRYVQKWGLPSWWTRELDSLSPLEAAGHIAERFRVDLRSLLDDTQEARFKPLLGK